MFLHGTLRRGPRFPCDSNYLDYMAAGALRSRLLIFHMRFCCAFVYYIQGFGHGAARPVPFNLVPGISWSMVSMVAG